MSGPRRRLLFLFPIALVVVAAFAVLFAILLRGHLRRQAVADRQQADVEAVRQRGGTVVFGPSGELGLAKDVKSVDLSDATVDAELMQTVSRFTLIERLTLDGAKLEPEACTLLGKLSRLRSLSLCRTNVTDTAVSRLPLGLRSLSLRGTSVADKSASRLGAMHGLVTLDLTDTEITPDGLRLLEPLRSLMTLWIDDSCITAESAESLRLMQPQVINVAVLQGMGQRAHEVLSVCEGPEIRGYDRDGCVLWEADSAWSDTLAGVVEAVVSEIGLDPRQAARLLEVLGSRGPPLGGWGRSTPGPIPAASWFSLTTGRPDNETEIASADEFIRELLEHPFDADHWALRRFARDKFTVGDVPKLLAAIRAAQSAEGTSLFAYGPYLLVRHGIDDPEVVAEMDRMLAHEDASIRRATVFAFGDVGSRTLFSHFSRHAQVQVQLYSRDEWTASEEADAFALPRLLRMCKGQRRPARDDARMVLVEIALSRPEYAAQVMSVLVDLLDKADPLLGWKERPIARVDVARLAEVAPDAAIAVVPRLRAMLKRLDGQLVGVPVPSPEALGAPPQLPRRQQISVLEALSATAGHSPELARQIALDYLKRREDGQPIGPFGPLLSPDTPKVNRKVVLELLADADVAEGELATVAKKIRDWATARAPTDQ